jgi:hypothetical protein
MQDQGGMPSISWCNNIGSRDGTITKDSYTKNCYFDPAVGEQPDLVKRPGTNAVVNGLSGTAQGLFKTNQIAIAIVGDSLYDAMTAHLYGAIPTPITLGVPYDAVSNTPNVNTSYFKSQTGMWQFVISGPTITKVTDVNYPAITVPGLAFLDGVFYVMDPTGKIVGSALNDGTTWPALDFLQLDGALGYGVGISRHLNYIAAFTSQGLQLLWDANAAPNGQGIALNPVLNASYTTGCVSGFTIQSIDDTTVFMGQTAKFSRGVYQLVGLQLTKISTPEIDRILNTGGIGPGTWVYASSCKSAGHSFYILTFPPTDINLTLVCDLTTQNWHVWSSVVGGVERAFVPRFFLNYGVDPAGSNGNVAEKGNLCQDTITGQTLEFQNINYTDADGPIPVAAVTPNYDAGSLNWKRFAAMFQIADTVNTTVNISFTDNDYQSFSTPRSVDMSSVRKMLRNCGSSRRRAWKLTHQDNTPLRLYVMNMDITILNR